MAFSDPRRLFSLRARIAAPTRTLAAVVMAWTALCVAAALCLVPVTAAAGPGPDRDDYLVIYHVQKPYGYMRTTRTTVVENGETLYRYTSQEEQHFRLPGSREMVVREEEEAYTDLEFRVRRFSFRRTSGPSKLLVEGVVTDGRAHLTITTAGMSVERTIDFPEDVYHILTLEDLIVTEGLKPDQVSTFKIFDVERLAPGEVTAAVMEESSFEFAGKKIETVTVFIEVKGSIQVFSMDREGHVYSIDVVGSYTTGRRVPSDKMPMLSAVDAVLDLAACPASVEIEDPADLRSMTVKVEVPWFFYDYLYPVDMRQEVVEEAEDPSGDFVTLTIKTSSQAEPKGPTVKIPVDADGELGPYLAEEVDELHKHPLVKRVAAEVVGGETDAWAAFLKIVDWVNANIPDGDDPYLATVPEALADGGTLGLDMRDDIIAALAKAAGIPVARVVGYVYFDGAFIGINWLEIWAGEWIPVDVNADDVLVSPTYIKITHVPSKAEADPLYAILRSSNVTLEEYETGAGVSAKEKSSFTLDGVYVNARHRYQLEVPVEEGWEVYEEPGGMNGPRAVVIPPEPSSSRISIQVLPWDAPDESVIPDDIKVRLGGVASSLSKFLGDLREDYREIGIGWQDLLGHTTCVLSCEYEAEGIKYSSEFHMFRAGDRMFVIEVSGPSKEFPKLKEKFRILVNGFYIAQ